MIIDVPKNIELLSKSVELSIFNPDTGPRSFDMLAYSGGTFDVGFGLAVIDIRGCEIPNAGVPIFRQHDPNKFVGRSQVIDNADGALRIQGVLFDNADGCEVAALSDQGAQWQASVGVSIDMDAAEFIDAGLEGAANGRAFDGPVLILRKTKLRESSFVPLGADSNTAAVALCDSPVVSLEFSTKKEADMADMETVKALTSQYAQDPQFALEAISSGWSLAEAQSKYADKTAKAQAERVAQLEAELAQKIADAEANLAKQAADFEAKLAQANKPAPAAAINSPASGSVAHGTEGLSAVDQWEGKLAEECARLNALGSNGLRRDFHSKAANIRAQATNSLVDKFPELHSAMLAEFNQNAAKSRGGR